MSRFVSTDFLLFHLAPALVALALTVLFARRLGRLAANALSRAPHLDPTVRSLLASCASGAVYVVGMLLALGALGVNSGAIAAALGATGLSIGLGLKDTLGDAAAGLVIVFLRPFEVGNFIAFRDPKDARSSGTVARIGLFATELKTVEGLAICVPNRLLLQEPLINYDRNSERLVRLSVGISYRDSIDAGVRALLETANAEKRALPDRPPQVFVDSLDESSVTLSMRVWVSKADYWPVRRALTQAAKEAIERAGLTIPFPQRDVHVYREET